MRKLPSFVRWATALALVIAPYAAYAQEAQLHPYELTAADAAAINARRPPDWSPMHVSAGDVFTIDEQGLIHIPTIAPAVGGGLIYIDDIAQKAIDR
jgi:hypothetical protein